METLLAMPVVGIGVEVEVEVDADRSGCREPWSEMQQDEGSMKASELLILGSGNAFAHGRYWSSLLLDRTVLLDAAPTIIPHLHRFEVDLASLELVMVTHLHGDHYFGLPFLLLEYLWLVEQQTPLQLIGPKGLREQTLALTRLAYPMSLETRSERLKLEFVEIDQAGEYGTVLGTVTAVPMDHYHLETYGYRFRTRAGKTLAYTGDTQYHDGLLALADGADVLVIECSSAGPPVAGHMDPAALQRLRAQLPARTRILATHLQAAVPGMAGVEFVEDFQRIVF